MSAADLDHVVRPAGSAAEQASGENFPVAMRVIPRHYRDHLWAIYRYARFVDDLGDEAPGDRRALLAEVAQAVDGLYAGRPVTVPEVAGLALTIAACGVSKTPLLALIRANEIDQEVDRYPTFDALVDYCRYSANPIGELVLSVFEAATPDRIALSDRICTGLQVIEHLQDIGEDYRAGRIYLPQTDLRRFGVAETDLGRDQATPQLRALLAYQTDRAVAWLNSGAVLNATLRGWARLAISGYLAGGRAAAARLAASGYNPLPHPPKPGPRHVAAAWLSAQVRFPG